jgi:hypothetical protein
MIKFSQLALSLLLFLAFGVSLIAQENGTNWRDDRPAPRFILKYSPISHLDFYNPVLFQLGLEHRLSDQLYLEHEVGLISAFRNQNGRDNEGQYKWGWRLQEEIRYYYNQAPQWNSLNAYLSGLATWRNTSFDNWVTASYRNGAYFRNFEAEVEEEIFALAFGIGAHILWDKVITIDMSAHYGVKYMERTSGVPNDADWFLDDSGSGWISPFEVRDEREGFFPHFIFSLKVGFIL